MYNTNVDLISLINFLEKVYASWGIILIFLSSFIETLPIGFIIPGSLMVALGGFFSYGDNFSLFKVMMSSTLGMMAAFLVAYFLGKKTGFYLIKKFHQEEHAKIAKALFKDHGAVILTTSLLANLTRFWISYIAGIEKYNLLKFLFYSFVAAFTWNSLFVAMGYFSGFERKNLEASLAKVGVLSYAFVLLAIAVITWNIKREYKKLKNK